MDPTAAPVDLELDGKIYVAHPLRDIDHETMNKWVRREYLHRLKDTFDGDDDLARVALGTAATMEWMRGEGLRITSTVSGMHRLARLLCRNQEISYDAIKSAKSVNSIMSAYRELHPVPEPEESDSDDKGKESPQ